MSVIRQMVGSDIPVISVKREKRNTSEAIPFFRKFSVGSEDFSICRPTRTTGFSIQKESAQDHSCWR